MGKAGLGGRRGGCSERGWGGVKGSRMAEGGVGAGGRERGGEGVWRQRILSRTGTASGGEEQRLAEEDDGRKPVRGVARCGGGVRVRIEVRDDDAAVRAEGAGDGVQFRQHVLDGWAAGRVEHYEGVRGEVVCDGVEGRGVERCGRGSGFPGIGIILEGVALSFGVYFVCSQGLYSWPCIVPFENILNAGCRLIPYIALTALCSPASTEAYLIVGGEILDAFATSSNIALHSTDSLQNNATTTSYLIAIFSSPNGSVI